MPILSHSSERYRDGELYLVLCLLMPSPPPTSSPASDDDFIGDIVAARPPILGDEEARQGREDGCHSGTGREAVAQPRHAIRQAAAS